MIGIIGLGFVGNAVYQKFKNYYKVYTFDLDKNKSNLTKNLIYNQEYIFLCLPTPMSENGSCNINILEKELSELNLYSDKNKINKIIIIKSTIPPGTTSEWNKKYNSLHIVFNPEFLTEANAVYDYENQNRIIIAGPKQASSKLKTIFLKVFPKAKIIETNSTNAEVIKYTTNTFLTTKVSFANEIYQICKSVGADYKKVIEYATLDKRLGTSHWSVPGPDGYFGFGGSCFPKDLSALLYVANKFGTTTDILEANLKTNNKVRKLNKK
tara:strand:+ start:680 stop:1483 length:804 start_codon:yes stop_codon:yes gene_type:complete